MVLAHVLQPSGRLPLRWLRLPLLLTTLGLSCVCIAVTAQALDRSNKLEKRIRTEAMSTGSTIVFNMNDIKSTTIVLAIVASLLALTSIVFSTLLSIDWIAHLTRPRPDMTIKEYKLDENVDKVTPCLPISTRTLRLQTLSLSFLTVWLLTVLIPSTVFSRTGSAHVTIQATSQTPPVLIDPLYWDYGFLRCLAAAPWFSFIFAFPASVVTWVAWKFSPPVTIPESA